MSSPIKVEMSENQLAELLVQAMLDKGIGKQLQQSIQSALTSHGVRQAIEAGVAAVAQKYAYEMILEHPALREQVEGVVRDRLTTEVMTRLFSRALGLKDDL